MLLFHTSGSLFWHTFMQNTLFLSVMAEGANAYKVKKVQRKEKYHV